MNGFSFSLMTQKYHTFQALTLPGPLPRLPERMLTLIQSTVLTSSVRWLLNPQHITGQKLDKGVWWLQKEPLLVSPRSDADMLARNFTQQSSQSLWSPYIVSAQVG